MVTALTPEDIADIVTRTADQSIGYEMNGVHFYDESVDGLVPASVSETSQELIGDAPVLDTGIAWRAFQTGETEVCNNLKEADNVFNEGTVLRSELAIPLGNHGVLLASDTEIGTFRDDDLTLIKILAKNAETALNQLQTEEELRDREQELERNQKLLDQTARAAKVGGWEFDLETGSGNWTDQIYQIYEKPPSESPSLTESIEAFHPEDRIKMQDAWQRLTKEGEPYDLELRLEIADETVKWVRVIGMPVYDDSGTEITSVRGIMQDITERKEREQELARQQDFFKQTQEVAHVGGWEVDLRTESLQWTDEVYRIHGEPLDYQPAIEDGISFYHPDDRDTLRDAFERVTANGEPYDLELRIVRNTGEIRWVRTRGEPWYQDDEIVGVRGTFQDITERKEREEELRKRNERLDEFAGLISHDLRNPLTVALGRTTYLQQICDGESAEQLEVIAKSLNRMEEIIGDTLTLARKGEAVGDTVPVSLLELCGTCWQGVDTGEATLNIDDEITVNGDANRLKHVFENLFRNAIEHSNDSVTISVGRTSETGFYVEDDGPGIPENDRGDVFEAGYSSESDGTGFGLTIVKRIAEAHGWEVSVTDGTDGGARFEFENVEFADTQ
ncbi:PAS domain-containing protein [Halomicroarcula sp. GCM10025324]|uniref:PAS domain-containing protein n=1 Tax=Halomicroarcula sp. GCM10025324 TaxID=3252667 RepID=UPI0036235BE3